MSVSSQDSNSMRISQKVVFLSLGLALGLVLSISSYSIFRDLGQSQQDASAKSFVETTPGFSDNTDALLKQIGFKATIGFDSSTSKLREFSEYLEKLSIENLVRAFSSSASQPFGIGLYPIQEILCEYLVEKSPGRALESVWLFEEHRRVVLLPIVFRNWVVQDLDESIRVATGLTPPYREIALNSILKEVDLTEETVSSYSSRLSYDLEALIDKRNDELRMYEAIDQDPNTVFEQLLSDDVDDYEQVHLFSHALSELIQMKGLDAIAMLSSFNYSSVLFDELFAQIARHDRVGTLNYIQDMRSSERYRFTHALMEDWVIQDADSALTAIQELSKPTFRRIAYQILASRWGWSDPREALNRLEEIPRQYRSMTVIEAVRTLGSTDPETVLRRLPSLRSVQGAFNEEIERTFVYSWSLTDPTAALQWVQVNVAVGSEQRARMLNRVLGEYSLVQPQKAMEIANKEDPSPAQGSLGLTFSVIRSLANNGQLDTAISFFDQVPENARAETYSDVAEQLVKEDRFDDVMSLSERFSETDKLLYFRSMVYALSPEHSSDVISLVARIPDVRLRSDVVNPLLSEEWITSRYYTTEQLDALKLLLAE